MERRRPIDSATATAANASAGEITDAETATNRAGIAEDIDNQVFIEMNDGQELNG